LRVAASTVEHHALISALRAAEAARSVTVRWLPVDQEARLQWDAFELACNEGTDLVCVMAANNEVGTVYPIREIAARAALSGAATLVDGTQAAGRLELSASDWGIGYLIVSGHKLYGPKGVGAVVSEHARSSRPVPESEDQSSGTPNVPGIVGLGEACRLRRIEGAVDERQAASLRDQLQFRLSQESEGLVVNGDLEHRLGGNLHVSVPGVPNDAVLARLHGLVAISTGSACRSGAQEPSHVLRAMALPRANIEGALRIGIGKFTTDEEIQLAARFIANAIADTRSAMKPAFGGDPSSPRSHQ
jgi:cysteine desulfurase